MKIINYESDVIIKNMESLPRGLNCRYLRCIHGLEDGEFVAKSWHRKLPDDVKENEVIVVFKSRQAH